VVINNPVSSNLSASSTNKDAISFISLLVIMVFWASLFSAGIFEIIGQIKGQVIILGIWVITLIFFGRNALEVAYKKIITHSLELFLLFVFVIVNVIHLLLGNGDMAYINFVESLILLCLYLTVLVHLKNSIKTYNRTVIFIMIIFGLNSIYVIPILFSNPFIAKLYDFGNGEITWFGSWSFFMPLAISMPCFIAIASRQNWVFRIFLYVVCISISLMIIISTFAASIILLLAGFVGLLLFSIKRKVKFILICSFIFLFITLCIKFYDFSEVPQIEAMVDKIGTIFTYKADLGNDDNDPRIRASLMQVSVNTFLQNPFFGAGLYGAREDGSDIIELHSGIIDSLAQYGLFGMMWYFGFIFIGFRRLIIYLRSNPSSLIDQARLITLFLFLIGAMANPALIQTSFCTLLFILALSPVRFEIASGKPLMQNDNLKSDYDASTV